MKNIIIIVVLGFLVFSCGEYENVTFDNINGQTLAYFKKAEARIPIEENGMSNLEVLIGVNTISSVDRTVKVSVVDDLTTATNDMYTLDSEFIIPANQYNATFNVTGIWNDSLFNDNKYITLKLTSIENGITSDSVIKIKLYEGCNPLNLLILSINFDGYASETTWELVDSSNNTIYNGGPYTDGDDSVEIDICIPDGEYTFTIHDAYGDGLWDGANTGTYQLSQGNVIYAEGSGSFGNCLVSGADGSTPCEDTTTFTKN